MQWARKIAQKKANGDEIEEDTESAGDAVMRNAALAVDVADRHFADRCAIPRSQRRDEAVQFAVERNLIENFAAISFEGGAEIVNLDAAQLGHQPVRNAGGNAPHPE